MKNTVEALARSVFGDSFRSIEQHGHRFTIVYREGGDDLFIRIIALPEQVEDDPAFLSRRMEDLREMNPHRK
jgi:hypothetical protein